MNAWRRMAIVLGFSVLQSTVAWGQPPKPPTKPPAKPPTGKEPQKDPPRWPNEHRPRPGRVVGWPYWFGYPAVYADPFFYPFGPGITVYPYDFAFQSPLFDAPPPTPPVMPPVRNDPPHENRPPARPREEPKPRNELDRRADVQKFVRQGNDAFALGEYAKAARLYQQAADTAPLEPMGLFHLAQAQIALAKYADAGVSIQRGLMLKPDWPNAPFDPRALYGELAGNFDKHLAQLAELVARNKNEDGLLFLLGYQLWFDGRKDEARVLFQRASALSLDALHVERFLRIKPNANPWYVGNGDRSLMR